MVKTNAEIREEAYRFFERMVGREMTNEEHHQLKEILKLFADAVQAPFPVREHLFTCRSCRKQVKKSGHVAMHAFERANREK